MSMSMSAKAPGRLYLECATAWLVIRQIALHALKMSLLILQLFPSGAALLNIREGTVIGSCCLPLRNIFTNTPLAEEVLDVAVSLVDSGGHFDEAVGTLCFGGVGVHHVGLGCGIAVVVS